VKGMLGRKARRNNGGVQVGGEERGAKGNLEDRKRKREVDHSFCR